MKAVRFIFGIMSLALLVGLASAQADPNDGCGKYSLEGYNVGYEAGFYSGRFDSNTSITELNFCIASYLYPTKDQVTSERYRSSIVGSMRKWSCKQNTISSNPDIDQCTAKVLPPENTLCLQTATAFDTKPTNTSLNPLCQRADAHGFVDPGEPTISAISGGNDQPWTRDCGGKYYNPITCKAPSKGKCLDTTNKLYDILTLTPDLCVNGKPDTLTLDADTYLYSRTCKGSETQYDATCTAQKTTTKGQCNSDYDSRYFLELGTGNGEQLCKYGLATDFTQKITNIDDQFGRIRTCAGSIPSLNASCFAHTTITKGICGMIVSNTPQETLTTEMSLCDAGVGTGIMANITGGVWNRTCAGSRVKDDVKCTTDIKITQAQCGVKNGQPCDTLDANSTDLCEVGSTIDWKFDETTQKRTWKCVGIPSNFSVACSAYKSVAGQCNSQLNGKTMKYDEIIKYPLCTIGSSNTTLKDFTTGGVWKRDCIGPNSGAVSSCYVNQFVDGECANLIGKVRTLPDQMCNAGLPISTRVFSGSFFWSCQGFNGGASMQCNIECIDGKCILPSGSGVDLNGDGIPDDVLDGLQPSLQVGGKCTDPDGCKCGLNVIFNGATCQDGSPFDPTNPEDAKNPSYVMPIFRPQLENRGNLYDDSMMLPGNADLIIIHSVNTGTAVKYDNLTFEVDYENIGPDPAYGVYIAYKYSDMLSGVSGSKPGTKIVFHQTGSTNTGNTQTANNVQTGVSVTGFDNYPYYLVIGTGNTGASLSGSQVFTNVMISGYANNCLCDGTICGCVVVVDGTTSQANSGSVNANNNSSLNASGTSTASTSDDIYQNVIFYYIGTLEPGQTGKLIVSGSVIASLRSDTIANIAQINSRVKDPDKTNNIASVSVLVKGVFTTALYLINPLIPLKNIIDNRKSILDRVGNTKSFRDVIIGHPRYMHIMTVQRNGIMKGYEYKYSTLFLPKRCVSRLEYILVMGRTMQFANNNYDVLKSPYNASPFKDVPITNPSNVKYVNRAYSAGITDVRKAGKTMQDVLGADKPVTHTEAKEAIYKLYRMMNYDTNALNSLFVGGTTGTNQSGAEVSCLAREETAYSIAHLLRGNPNIVMGFNDIFVSKFYDILLPMSVAKRRDAIARVVAKLKFLPTSTLYKLGLDNETLMGVLGESLKGKEYKSDYNASSSSSFFSQVTTDQYDQYLLDQSN